MIVSDVGPLIAFAKTNNLSILKEVFTKIRIPPAVLNELKLNTSRPGAESLHTAIFSNKWIEVSTTPVQVPEALMNSLDQGELEAIFLAKTEGLVLLIDEKKGRNVASNETVRITGTGAALIAAKRREIINGVSPIIDDLVHSGYRISTSLQKKF